MVKKIGIVAFSFGAPATIRSNRQIGDIVSKAKAPVYTQLDVPINLGVDVEYTEEKPGNPPPTLRIARGAIRWAVRRGFTRLLVAVAKPHSWRCLRDLEQAVCEVKARIEVLACKEVEEYPEDSWFCSDSTQERTSSRESWEKRERILRRLPFFLYKKVAG